MPKIDYSVLGHLNDPECRRRLKNLVKAVNEFGELCGIYAAGGVPTNKSGADDDV